MASSEVSPYATTGGMGDVLGALPAALARRGHRVAVIMPFYHGMKSAPADLITRGKVTLGEKVVSYEVARVAEKEGVQILAVRQDAYFDREHLYGSPDRSYEDNAERFIFFNRAVHDFLSSGGFNAGIVHCHDWHTALLPVLIDLSRHERRQAFPRSVFTIHNMAFQGIFPAREFRLTGLPPNLFAIHGLEFYGNLNLMKGGILFADAITTVSPTYAREIQGSELGFGLNDVLRSRVTDLRGIVNGIDPVAWDPHQDPHLEKPFGVGDMEGKCACKRALLRDLGLPESSEAVPIFGVVSRLTEQKGMGLLLEALPRLLQRGTILALLGRGQQRYENAFRKLAAENPTRAAVRFGFDERLAHRIFAGSDFYLMPSLFEPCGLSQLHAMRYGSIPIVRATGGLQDSVTAWNPRTNEGNGFKFHDPLPEALLGCTEQAIEVYWNAHSFETLRRSAMQTRFSWDTAAEEYEKVYQSALPHA